MPRFSGTALASARLRASPRFKFVAPDLLAADTGRRSHLVTPETAALLRSVAKPRRTTVAAADRKAVARLILDGMLGIEDDGRFCSGPSAHHLFFGKALLPRPRDAIGKLSLAALGYAASLGSEAPTRLSDRLYRYNSRPISPLWRRRFPDDATLSRFLNLDRVSRSRGNRASARGIVVHQSGTWYAWDVPGARAPSPNAPRYKLYVSPEPAETATACDALRALLGTRTGPFTMKVGRELPSLLRADRLVAYFASQDDLFEGAARMRNRLDGLAAQGVPFTSTLGADGLLSWGADMPVNSPLGTDERERSWRSWVVSRLGFALSRALQSGAASPVRFALDRVFLDGVDTTNWAPSPGLLQLATTLSSTIDADT